jgi:hypothetical protein
MSRTIKITTINQAEDFINRQNVQINSLTSQLNQVEAKARAEAQRAATERINAERTAMDQRLTQEVNNLQNKMQWEIDAEKQARIQMDIEHRRLLQKQENDFYSRLENEMNDVREWTQDLVDNLQDLVDDLEVKVNESFTNQQMQINDVRERINNLYEKEANEQIKAQKLLIDIIERAKTADKDLLHNKFAPGRLAQIERDINNISPSDPAATNIANARRITNDLLNLGDEVRKKRMIFNALHDNVLKEAEAVLKIMAESRKIYPKDQNGNLYQDENRESISLEIDYWTNGKYSGLEKELQALEKELKEKKDSVELTIDRLHNILDRIVAIRKEQNDLVIETLKKGNASEERIKISEDIINAMLEQGYQLKDVSPNDPAHNYLGGEEATDPREGVFAILKNANGTEVTILVNTDERFCNQVVFQRNDELPRTEAEFRKGLDEIKKILEQGAGIKMGELNAPSGTGDDKQVELADPRALAKAGGISRELKKRLGFVTQ